MIWYGRPSEVAAWSNALVYGRSPVENAGSNPAERKNVSRACSVLSGRRLCDGLIKRPEESY